MADIKEAATCISFIEHSEQEHSHVHSWLRFTIHGDVNHTQPGCWAFVGKQGGEQVINLTPPDCHTREVVTHEVMHSLGVFHEHNRSLCLSHPQTLQVLFLPLTRPDRDEHVRVLMENIQEENKQNFEKREYKMGEVEELVTPYDIYRKKEEISFNQL